MLIFASILKVLLIGVSCFIAGRVYQDDKNSRKRDEHRRLQKKYVYPRLSK